MCLRSTNAESTERLFSQIKHISQQATNRKPDNVLTTILLSMQAKKETGMNSTISSIHKQGSMVAEVAKKVPPYSGSFFSKAFLLPRMASWQTHLQRISSYLQYGEGYGGRHQMMAINFLIQTRTYQLKHVAQPYVILGINAYRMYGILAE